MRPGGCETSGGSLRSSRQAVACHPFTRSWATMPPEAPPPPGLLCNMVFTDGHFHVMRLPVSIKTFSTHVVVKKCHVVSEPGLFTHEKIHRRGLAEEHGGWRDADGKWMDGRKME